jgi:7-alpha-hydroxysteroid dehydrogenase
MLPILMDSITTAHGCEDAMTAELFRLDDRVAIVTGAGRGIGAATAVALAAAGADVVLSSRTEADLAAVAEAVKGHGRRAAVVPADLSDLDAVARLAEAAREEFGRIDVVVNNVGGTPPRAFLDTSPGFMARAFSFNVLTAHALTRAAVPVMLENGGGSVVSVTSAMGRLSGRGYLGYGTAKAALAHWSELAAADLAPRVRVNAVAAGAVATSALESVTTNDELREMLEAVPLLRRIGTPEEIAATVVWLCSPAGAYVTGKIIEVDGGLNRPNLEIGLPDL